MDSTRWERMQALFHEAAELPKQQWRAFLDTACPFDDALAEDVLAMLEEDSRGSSLLDRDVAHLAEPLIGHQDPSLAAREFGPYRIGPLLGEGGMGVVYLAEREDLGSLAAIKILRDAWLSPFRRERFLSEQRTLAKLNHPSIARLYDADALPDGTPWFVMEYVDGPPLTEYCRRRQSSICERLELFRCVCEAVQYAHQHAIIHRDLKPSNILVKSDGTVRLLDFGIAKQLDEIDQRSDRTLTGLRLMTPAYAAPEQLRNDPVGVYTDVYSLGVILYELVSGRVPFDFSNCTPSEAADMIVERQPEKPSPIGDASAGKLASADLAVLCLTAMHKDVARRYRSVEALIRDIDHYLSGEPLEARPDSLRYRLGKFAGRNRRAVTGAAAVLAVVAGLIIFFTVRLTVARNAALAQAARAQRIQEFMLNLFEGGDRSAGPANALRAETVVEMGVREARALDSEPAVQAELYQTLGRIYQKLGNLERADSLLSLALQQRRHIFGSERSEVAESLVTLALLRVDEGRLQDAERLVREGLAMSRSTLRPGDPALSRAQTALGSVLENRGDYPEAIAALEQAVQMESGPNVPPSDRTATLSALANAQFYKGNYAVSQALNERVLAMHEKTYGKLHPLVADDLINLASIQNNQGHYSAAEAYERRALDINRSWYGKDHPETGASLDYLGQALVMQGRFDEGEKMLQESLAISERSYGAVHQRVALALNELGMLAMRRGRFDEAQARFERAVYIDKAVYGDRHPTVALESANLASVYLEKKQYVRAEQLLRAAIASYGATLPPGHLNIGIAEIKLGRALLGERRYPEAERMLLGGYEIVSKQASPSVSWLQAGRKDLITLYVASGHPEKAEPFRIAEAAQRKESQSQREP